jgi:hypothetical protein
LSVSEDVSTTSLTVVYSDNRRCMSDPATTVESFAESDDPDGFMSHAAISAIKEAAASFTNTFDFI